MAYEQFCSVIYKFWFFQLECNFPKNWHCVIVFYCTSLRMYHSAGYKANTEYILLMDSFQLFAMLITVKDFPAIFLKNPSSLRTTFVSHLSISLESSEYVQHASRFLCFLSHHQRSVWQKLGPRLLSFFHTKGLCFAKYCFMLLS